MHRKEVNGGDPVVASGGPDRGHHPVDDLRDYPSVLTARGVHAALIAAIERATFVEERWQQMSAFLDWRSAENRIRKRAWERYVNSWRIDQNRLPGEMRD